MSGIRFRGVRVVSGEAEKFSNIAIALLLALVFMFAMGAPFIFLLIYTRSIYAIPVIALLVGLTVTFFIARSYLKRAARVELMDDGLILGGRLIPWKDIGDVKAWLESYKEVEVESTPVIGYGMYGYAYGKTLPTSATYVKYDYIFLQVFHSGGVDTICMPKESYWPFVKTLSKILNQRGLAPKWLRDLENMEFP
ncbi:MAG: hypothetical protein LM600_02170 [Thaumarchaeota archaeon]|nr:hypothetical protein [Nitrososphaerota archaeon]